MLKLDIDHLKDAVSDFNTFFADCAVMQTCQELNPHLKSYLKSSSLDSLLFTDKHNNKKKRKQSERFFRRSNAMVTDMAQLEVIDSGAETWRITEHFFISLLWQKQHQI